jgi:cell division protein FtsB
MAEQTQEPGINLGQTYGINTLISSLMDVQQVIRNLPNLLAQLDALKAENEKLKNESARLNAVIEGLASSGVEVKVAE